MIPYFNPLTGETTLLGKSEALELYQAKKFDQLNKHLLGTHNAAIKRGEIIPKPRTNSSSKETT